MTTTTEVEFHAKVLKVEERFRKAYDPDSFGSARAEGTAIIDLVSTGWWVLLDGWPIAMRFGKFKPSVEAGQTMIMEFRIKPDPPEPAELVVVPDPPKGPNLSAGQVEYLRKNIDPAVFSEVFD